MNVTNTRYLIINADDFGLNESTNKAILELFEQRLITSSSLLTVAPFSKQAVNLASANNLASGIHLTINSDDNNNRWQSNSGAKSLSDDKGLRFNMKELAFKTKSKDVTKELEAQYRFMLDNGCKPDHADNHCGTLYGINGRLFFVNAFRFCKKYDLPFRFPKSPAFLARQFGRKAPALLILAHKLVLKTAEHFGVCLPDDMFSNPYRIKNIRNYESLRDYYIDELNTINHGITEIFLHPSYPIESNANDEWQKREYELKLLKSGDLLQIIEDRGITLCNWANAPFKNRGKR